MLKKMLWIGLTGGIATGKSTVSDLFTKNQIPVIDADKIAHQALGPGTPGLKAVVQAFGPGLLREDQSLDRAKLAEVVFSDSEKLKALEGIVHPFVRDEVERQRKQYEQKGCSLCVYDVPLLYEKNMQAQFDGVLVVSCSQEQQLARLMARQKLKQDDAEKRIRAQLPLSYKTRLATWVLNNDDTVEALESRFSTWLEQLKIKMNLK